MSDNQTSIDPVQETNSTLDKIYALSNLANAVQDESLKSIMLAFKGGERLYQIFANAVAREIETMMNPTISATKDVVDAQEVAQKLREQMIHMYNAMNELNNTRLMGVLTMLNTSLGGNPVNHPPAAEPMRPKVKAAPQQQQPQVPQQEAVQPEQSGNTRLGRSNGTGISW